MAKDFFDGPEGAFLGSFNGPSGETDIDLRLENGLRITGRMDRAEFRKVFRDPNDLSKVVTDFFNPGVPVVVVVVLPASSVHSLNGEIPE